MRSLILVLALTASCGSQPEASTIVEPVRLGDVTAVVTEVRLEGEQVVSFIVETRDAVHEILIDASHDYGFNLRHLEKHQATGDPVLVETETRNGGHYAVSILDT